MIGSYARKDRHPAWYLNLAARPEAEARLGSRLIRVRASTASGAERERLWRRVVAADPAYAEYQARTSREIPVVILEPRAAVA